MGLKWNGDGKNSGGMERWNEEMERIELGLKWSEEMGRRGKGWRQMKRWNGEMERIEMG